MEAILYISIFFIGIVFGSFFTLAVYRIPKKEDITHVRSYCPNCNHKLQFLDLIPIFSYLFLGGKCRYCKKKIRPRYLILEALSGIVFLAVAIGQNFVPNIIDFVNGKSCDLVWSYIINLAITYLFIAGTFIIAEIDKEKKEIPNGLIIYELVIGFICVVIRKIYGFEIINNILAFMIVPLIMLFINLILQRKIKDENNLPFGMGDIKYIAVAGLFMGFGAQITAIVLAIFIVLIWMLIEMIIKKGKIETQIPFGFFFTMSNVIVLILYSNLELLFEAINSIILFW